MVVSMLTDHLLFDHTVLGVTVRDQLDLDEILQSCIIVHMPSVIFWKLSVSQNQRQIQGEHYLSAECDGYYNIALDGNIGFQSTIKIILYEVKYNKIFGICPLCHFKK